jgi:hypothetical protein
MHIDEEIDGLARTAQRQGAIGLPRSRAWRTAIRFNSDAPASRNESIKVDNRLTAPVETQAANLAAIKIEATETDA